MDEIKRSKASASGKSSTYSKSCSMTISSLTSTSDVFDANSITHASHVCTLFLIIDAIGRSRWLRENLDSSLKLLKTYATWSLLHV